MKPDNYCRVFVYILKNLVYIQISTPTAPLLQANFGGFFYLDDFASGVYKDCLIFKWISIRWI
jgi:hypothetical protein